MWNTTSIYDRNLDALVNAKARCIVNKGGARSGKTWSILQLLYLLAQDSSAPLMISVVSETLPHLKKGCIRDFRMMLESEGKWNDAQWNATDKVYKVGKSAIEFFGCDSPAKVHGPARDVLFVNECYNIKWEVFRQLDIRTRKVIFLDYNPCSRFWVDDKLVGKDGVVLIHSTYKDNTFLTAQQVAAIESGKSDVNWWRVYGLGETGSNEGVIYTNWEIVEQMPSDVQPYQVAWGVDFGYNDPTAIVRCAFAQGAIWVDEVCYMHGMDNLKIARTLVDAGCNRQSLVVADCAEPKSIAEVNAAGGLHLIGSLKGADSVMNGIQVVRRYPLKVTRQSTDVIKELRNYQWRQDGDGNYMNVPEHEFSHSMDALRYVVQMYLRARRRGTAKAHLIEN